jgi:hypothetical protein
MVQKNGRVDMTYRCRITGKSVVKAINKFDIADSCPLPDFGGDVTGIVQGYKG